MPERTVRDLVARAMFRTVTLFHESFIHGDLLAKDYMDNKKFDYSNISEKIKRAAGNIPQHYHHYKVLLDFNDKGYNSPNLWPKQAFFGLKKINDKLKVFESDQGLINTMWNYQGGVEIDSDGNVK